MTTIGKGALLFLGGVLFGTAGVKVLSSKDAKKAYTHCTAAALRAKDSVMKTVTKVQENAEDIYAEAVELNEERILGPEFDAGIIEDKSDVRKAVKETVKKADK